MIKELLYCFLVVFLITPENGKKDYYGEKMVYQEKKQEGVLSKNAKYFFD